MNTEGHGKEFEQKSTKPTKESAFVGGAFQPRESKQKRATD
jgi:hypothetical protein